MNLDILKNDVYWKREKKSFIIKNKNKREVLNWNNKIRRVGVLKEYKFKK